MQKVVFRDNKKIRLIPTDNNYGVYVGDREYIEIHDLSKVDDKIKYRDIICDSCDKPYQKCHCGNWTNPEDRSNSIYLIE